jgi:hypothetical protein
MMMMRGALPGARCALVALSLLSFAGLSALPAAAAPLASSLGPEVVLAEPRDGFV